MLLFFLLILYATSTTIKCDEETTTETTSITQEETTTGVISNNTDGGYLDDDTFDDSDMQTTYNQSEHRNIEEDTAQYWRRTAHKVLIEKFKAKPITNVAKNVILFLGDGMSIPTLTASRIYIGGEEQQLSFDRLPYTALSKTYCVDAQTADSACTSTAYLTGVKNNKNMIGVTAAVAKNDCEGSLLRKNRLESIAKWSQDAGKRTGIVTTSTVMDASPAGAFAKIANRKWQTDGVVKADGGDFTKCKDITHQLVRSKPGSEFNVILGGGSINFLTTNIKNEYGQRGRRTDRSNLIKEWESSQTAKGRRNKYIYNRKQLLNLDPSTNYVLGLFNGGYLPFNLDRDKSVTPSLQEMTAAAIKIVGRGNGARNGYFLFIEGGRIDHGHHGCTAQKALDETIEFSKAIQTALDMTSEKDTLIVVTADHAHTMSISGYPVRNASIFGPAGISKNQRKRLTINYANGAAPYQKTDGVDADDTHHKNYRFPSIYRLSTETHGGDDVAIHARGPWAHLFSGVIEQHLIPHIMAFASCVGTGPKVCSMPASRIADTSSASLITPMKWTLLGFAILPLRLLY